VTDQDGRFRTDVRALSGGDIETIAVVGMLTIVLVMGGAVGAGVLLLDNDGGAPELNFSFTYRDSAQRLDVYYEQGPEIAGGDVLLRAEGETATWASIAGTNNSTTIEPPTVLNLGPNSSIGSSIERDSTVEVLYVSPESGEREVVSVWNGTGT
jgi:hypothetical protein